MINPITPKGREAVSLSGVSAAAGGGARAGTRAMGKVGGRIADRLAREFKLVEREAHHDYAGGSASDLYGVEEAAAELSAALGGSPADRGRIARSLHEFAQEVAAMIAARPGSRSLVQLQSAMDDEADSRAMNETDRVVDAIDAATRRLRDGSPR